MDNLLSEFTQNPPATVEMISEYEVQASVTLPSGYVEFLKRCNGGEGFIGENSYVIFWSVDELASMNEDYEVQEYMPGLLMFGSNGGGEAYGFDTRNPQWKIVQVPFIGMEWNLAQPLGLTFREFLEQLSEAE